MSANIFRPLRSILFVPGDSERKISRSKQSEADAVILDLEDSVHPANKKLARQITAAELAGESGCRLMVRVNALYSGEFDNDLDALTKHPPETIVLPKCSSYEDICTAVGRLDAAGLKSTRLLPVATESASALRNLMRSDWFHPRLLGLTWGAEDIAADIGALSNREEGAYTGVYCLARDVCLLAAREAGVLALDTAFIDVRNHEDCAKESAASYRAGFDGKLAIHPSQVRLINSAFTPSSELIEWAHRVLDALDRSGQGVALLDGKMIDIPHQRSAQKILRAAGG
ncbi:CoA ester lyase [Castellaniella sp.]|uniref:HpcH/HpaI aldolase/citrate lyase family protein n=1 Tax=Castellaniella sp. TaxID=1955812 RepID=UPI0035610A7B